MQKEKCLTPGCIQQREIRGLCDKCRASVGKLIRDREITEEKAIELGLILPRHKAVQTLLVKEHLRQALSREHGGKERRNEEPISSTSDPDVAQPMPKKRGRPRKNPIA